MPTHSYTPSSRPLIENSHPKFRLYNTNTTTWSSPARCKSTRSCTPPLDLGVVCGTSMLWCVFLEHTPRHAPHQRRRPRSRSPSPPPQPPPPPKKKHPQTHPSIPDARGATQTCASTWRRCTRGRAARAVPRLRTCLSPGGSTSWPGGPASPCSWWRHSRSSTRGAAAGAGGEGGGGQGRRGRTDG
jgi:hypothetical protein